MRRAAPDLFVAEPSCEHENRHERNIEVGVQITSERFACHLAAQFHAAISDGVLARIG